MEAGIDASRLELVARRLEDRIDPGPRRDDDLVVTTRLAIHDQGDAVRVGLEPELILFKPGENGEYQPVESGGMFSLGSLDHFYPFWQSVIDALRVMNVEVEQLGKEYGPGQYEGTPHYAEPLKAVDDYLTYKEVIRSLARDAGMVATFMPKPYAHMAGSGLHIHLSLWDREGNRDKSIGEADDAPLSKLGGRFVAGLLDHARALVGVGSPIVNSYKRLQPGSWAPAHICWGVGNRAALLSDLVTSESQRAGLAAELAALTERLRTAEARRVELIEPAARLEDLQRDFAVAEAVFASAMARSQTTKTDLYASYPLVQVLEDPSLPVDPTSPKRKLAAAAGIAATVFLLIGLTLGWIRRPLIDRLLAKDDHDLVMVPAE